ncbi:MAG: hypothetical protein M3O72_06570 [Verrucomicrobiota bacterium]|nr:hypothetical protein [Verrucomicrobiota bacterium]
MNMEFRSGLLPGQQQLSRPTDTVHGGLESDPLLGQGVGEAAAERGAMRPRPFASVPAF